MLADWIEALDLEVVSISRERDMPIVASASSGSVGNFTPHPEGTFAAVCVDVYDVGMVEVTWQGVTKKQHKIEIYFFCGKWTEPNEKGEKFPMLARERFTLSLSDKGNLRPFLESWRGKPFTAAELEGFDVEKLIGAPALITVLHNESGDKVYANVKTAMRMLDGVTPPSIPEGFERRHIRDAKKAAENNGGPQKRSPFDADEEDDLPF